MKLKLVPVFFGATSGLIFGQTLSPERLEARNARVEAVSYLGRSAVRVTHADPAGGDGMAIVRGTEFQDGTIELALSGDTAPDADVSLRGFVGIAFRVAGQGAQYECIYLRPKNGRSPDQLQRNHSTQYVSVPGFPWPKLRSETPGKYESYVDLVPGKWTQVRIQVAGVDAKLYVNGAPVSGPVGLWVGPGTIAHFADLKLIR